ncbi:MAG: hypothetical protein JXR77_01760 [Lentisphaeria bacterium]|nr:hypothetical protein [Lentisphaeria bacterium]
MKRWSVHRERLLLIGAGAGVLLLVLDRLVLNPFLAAWRTRADTIRELETSLVHGLAMVDQESRWLRWRREANERLLPGEAAAAENALLTRVDAWARRAGLTVTSLRPRWKEMPDRRSIPELQVIGGGSMSAVVQFVHQVETSPLAVAVEHLEITPGTRQSAALVVDLRISGLCAAAGSAARTTP